MLAISSDIFSENFQRLCLTSAKDRQSDLTIRMGTKLLPQTQITITMKDYDFRLDHIQYDLHKFWSENGITEFFLRMATI